MTENVDALDKPIIGVSLVVFTDEFGPYLSASTMPEFRDEANVRISLNFAHKVTLVCSMGDKVGELEKIHGPVDIDLLEDPIQECFAYPILLKDDHSIDSRILAHGRLVVVTVHYMEDNRKVLRPYESKIETTLKEMIYYHLYDESINRLSMEKMRTDEEKTQLLNNTIKALHETIELLKEREKFGVTIFNLSTIRLLPEDHQPIAYELIMNPDGTTVEQIIKKIRNLKEENVRKVLRTLVKMDYVEVLEDERGTIYKALA